MISDNDLFFQNKNKSGASTIKANREMINIRDLPSEITIEIFTWLNQNDLVEMSLVSKQINGIITNGPESKNLIAKTARTF